MRVGPPPALRTAWLSTRPSIISLSSIVPPTFLTILMFRRSTFSAVLGSIVFNTESTAIGPSKFECWETILEERDVDAAWRRVARSEREMGCDMSWRVLTAAAAALWKDSEIIVGCNPIHLISLVLISLLHANFAYPFQVTDPLPRADSQQ